MSETGDTASVKIENYDQTFRCRCCGVRFPSNAKYEEHLSVK